MDPNNYRDYVVDSNEAVTLKFVREPEDLERPENSFKPDMSHQIFCDTETIFGYKNLEIQLYYTPGWLRTYFNVRYDSKIDTSELVIEEADNVVEAVTKFLDHDFYTNIDRFVNSLKEEPTFKPFGDLIHSFTVHDEHSSTKTYEIYHLCGSKLDERFIDYYMRLQPFIMWYIDSACFIDTDDEKWQYFIVYEKYKNSNLEHSYAVAGFATVYEYYAYPFNLRPRISQVLILPPFRKQGVAAYLYDSICKYYFSNDTVLDITVEDSSIEFQRLRDFVDCLRCEHLPCCSPTKLWEGFKPEMFNELRNRFKIHKKQARRVYEILLLRSVNRSDVDIYQKYRLVVKRRLNHPFEKLGKHMRQVNSLSTSPKNGINGQSLTYHLSKESRLEQLKNQYDTLEDEYTHVIDRMIAHPIKL